MNAPDPAAPRRLRRFPLFRVETFLFFLVPTALLAAFFFRPFLENERFAYRDVGYFYYPLFEQIHSEWERGRLPLWDPFENLGQPLAGNPTSSVFYPGKAIFFLSSAGCVDFNACFSLYIIGHVALSFFGVYFLTRRLRISRAGAVLAGTSYSFSGPILFQYSNVVFLVGAAWLPFLALFSFDFFASATVGGKLKSALKLSVAQALAILGGEPQIVYLSTLAFFAFSFFAPVRLALPTVRTPREIPTAQALPTMSPVVLARRVRRVRDRFRNRLALGLLLAVGASTATFFLAAPQILPSAELIARSERAAAGVPRSLWEIPAALWRSSVKNNAVNASERKASPSEKAQNSAAKLKTTVEIGRRIALASGLGVGRSGFSRTSAVDSFLVRPVGSRFFRKKSPFGRRPFIAASFRICSPSPRRGSAPAVDVRDGGARKIAFSGAFSNVPNSNAKKFPPTRRKPPFQPSNFPRFLDATGRRAPFSAFGRLGLSSFRRRRRSAVSASFGRFVSQRRSSAARRPLRRLSTATRSAGFIGFST